MANFSLAATGNSPWFMLLGPGSLRFGVLGTWAGTVIVEELTPDGARTVSLPDASASAFTGNTGSLELANPKYPVRFGFTRSSGTATPWVNSAESQIYFPNADANGGGLTFDQLPTADPEDAGALWNNSGVVTSSAG